METILRFASVIVPPTSGIAFALLFGRTLIRFIFKSLMGDRNPMDDQEVRRHLNGRATEDVMWHAYYGDKATEKSIRRHYGI